MAGIRGVLTCSFTSLASPVTGLSKSKSCSIMSPSASLTSFFSLFLKWSICLLLVGFPSNLTSYVTLPSLFLIIPDIHFSPTPKFLAQINSPS